MGGRTASYESPLKETVASAHTLDGLVWRYGLSCGICTQHRSSVDMSIMPSTKTQARSLARSHIIERSQAELAAAELAGTGAAAELAGPEPRPSWPRRNDILPAAGHSS